MLGKGSALSIAMWFGLRCEIAKLYAIVTERLQQQYINVAEDYITADAIKKSASNLIPAGNIIVPTRMALGKVAIGL